MSNQAIKLFKELIAITTNKKDIAELKTLLKQTENDNKNKNVNKKFNINKLPAKQAKSIGFKTKKAMIDFIKINEFDNKYNSEAEFTKFITGKYKMFNQLKEVTDIHTKRQANSIVKKQDKQPIKKIVTYTAKFILFIMINKDDRDMYKAYSTALDNQGNLYVSLFAVRLNVTDPAIYNFASGNGRTYRTQKDRWDDLTTVMYEDPRCPDLNVSGGFDLIVVCNVETPNVMINYDIFKPKDKEVWSSDNEGGLYHPYINYNINNDAKSFNELFNIPVCDYVLDNYKANSCFINILVDTFRKSFENNKHYKFKATYEDFCDLLDIEMKNDNMGLTINKSLVFFKKFGVKLCAIGRYSIIEMFKPEKRNKNLSCDCLYLLVSNNHCYKLNENLESFSKKIWLSDEIITDEMKKVDIVNLKNTHTL